MLPLTDPRRLAHTRIAALAREVPRAASGVVAGVHQARVASRRLRALLPLYGALPAQAKTARKLASRVRRLTRGLGPVRELDVAAVVLDQVCGREPVHARAGQVVRDEIIRAREAAVPGMLEAIASADLQHIAARTHALASALAPPAARRRVGVALAERLAARGLALQEALETAGQVYASDRLHEVRIAAKKYRYTIELAEELGRLRLRGTLRRLKRVQDLLGSLHDLEVLAVRVRDRGAASTDAQLREALAALARGLDAEARALHGTFLEVRPSLDQVFVWAGRAGRRFEAAPVRAQRRGRMTGRTEGGRR